MSEGSDTAIVDPPVAIIIIKRTAARLPPARVCMTLHHDNQGSTASTTAVYRCQSADYTQSIVDVHFFVMRFLSDAVMLNCTFRVR